jgi:acetyl-CoA synthetase/medium-chain acyl-CoA synthetase
MGVAVKRLRIGRRRVDPEQSSSPLELATAPALVEDRWKVPDRFNFTRDVVEALALDMKRRALTFTGRDGIIEPRTFLQLAEGATHWATVLRERGVEPGDRVVVFLGSGAPCVEAVLGCIKVGAVAVPCSPHAPIASLETLVASTGATLVVAEPAAESELAQLSFSPEVQYVEHGRTPAFDRVGQVPTHDTSSRDVALVLSSGAMDGATRLVAHTHGSTFASRVQAEHWLDAARGDAVWCTADTGTAQAWWSGLLGPWGRGAETVLHDHEFDAHEQLDLLHRLSVTILCQSPAEYRALAELPRRDLERYRSGRLRRLVSTGDYLEPDVAAVFEEVWETRIHDGYGQAETNIVLANGTGAEFREGALGAPLPGHHVAVVDGQGNELPPGIEGDLAVRGRPPTLFAGYWESPEETKQAFSGDWYLTGDVAVRDEEGVFWFVGRADDVIASRGRTFGPYEVERVLREHRAVRRAAVVGVRDLERGGHYVRAFVVLDPRVAGSEQLGAELRQHVAESLPEQHVPREVEFIDQLPTAPNGKIRRDELRERPVTGRPLWEKITPAAEQTPAPSAVVAAPEPPPVAPPAAPPPPEPVTPVPEPAPPAPEPVPAVAEAASAVTEAAPAAPPLNEPSPPPEPVAPASEAPPAVVPEPVPAVEPEPLPAPPEPEPAPEAPASVPVAESPAAAPVAESPAATEPDASVPAAPVEHAPPPEPAPLPEPLVSPEPLPEFVVVPPPETEPVAAAPPPPQPAPPLEPPPGPLPDFVVDPADAPEPVAPPPPPARPLELEPEPDLGPLPDYVVDPERTTPLTPVPTARHEPQEPEVYTPPEREDPLAGLGLKPVTEFPEVESTPGRETPPGRRRHASGPVAPDSKRSLDDVDPGDESEEVGWMQGLSNRLSAYSLETGGPEAQPEQPEQPEAKGEDEGAPNDDAAG